MDDVCKSGLKLGTKLASLRKGRRKEEMGIGRGSLREGGGEGREGINRKGERIG